jgi:hypothetical protein
MIPPCPHGAGDRPPLEGPSCRRRETERLATHFVGSLDPLRLVDDPTLSLYCLEAVERTGIFVRTPSHVDLSRAPFLYQTQFAEATEDISVPFREMHNRHASTLRL